MQVFLEPPDGASRGEVPQPVSLEDFNTWAKENRQIFFQLYSYKPGAQETLGQERKRYQLLLIPTSVDTCLHPTEDMSTQKVISPWQGE